MVNAILLLLWYSIGHYIDGEFLKQCGSNCIRCSKENMCDECKYTFKKVPNQNVCLQSLEGFYPEGDTFKECGNNCKNCKDLYKLYAVPNEFPVDYSFI